MNQTNLALHLALLCALGLGACHRDEQSSVAAPKVTAPSASALASQKELEAPTSTIWPDGWIIVADEEWIPVIDDTGNDLIKARLAFLNGDTTQAGQQTRAAARAIRTDEATRTAADKTRLEPVARQLDELATRIEQDKSLSAKEVATTLASAYRSAAGVSWLYLREESGQPTFEQPRVHFESALGLLALHDGHGAANEIRRGAGYFRLAANSARSDDRQALDVEVRKLDKLAVRADSGDLAEAELRSTLAQVDAAYAGSYLHQAEAEYRARQVPRAGRGLREAAARMRARSRWLATEVIHVTSGVAGELDATAAKLGRGIHVAAQKLEELVERARQELGLPAKTGVASHRG